jgi:hypothetical protein
MACCVAIYSPSAIRRRVVRTGYCHVLYMQIIRQSKYQEQWDIFFRYFIWWLKYHASQNQVQYNKNVCSDLFFVRLSQNFSSYWSRLRRVFSVQSDVQALSSNLQAKKETLKLFGVMNYYSHLEPIVAWRRQKRERERERERYIRLFFGCLLEDPVDSTWS